MTTKIEATNRTAALRDIFATLAEAAEYLQNGTPIRNGSDLHADIVASRDRLKSLLENK